MAEAPRFHVQISALDANREALLVREVDMTERIARWLPMRAEMIASGEREVARPDLNGTIPREIFDCENLATIRVAAPGGGSFKEALDAYLDRIGSTEALRDHLAAVRAAEYRTELRRRFCTALEADGVREIEAPTEVVYHQPSDTFLNGDEVNSHADGLGRPEPYWACDPVPYAGVEIRDADDLTVDPEALIEASLDEHHEDAAEDLVAPDELADFIRDFRKRRGIDPERPEDFDEELVNDPELRNFLKRWAERQTIVSWSPNAKRVHVEGGDLAAARATHRALLQESLAEADRARQGFNPPARRARQRETMEF